MSTVIVTSPPLSEAARELAERYLPSSLVLVWEQGDLSSKSAIRSTLRSGQWSLCISFYNDYIFKREEIEQIGCVVNIHPALPHLRGRGYDVIPLINGHTMHGATLHFVSESIDAGRIIEVISQQIPQYISYQDFRLQNQKLCLQMLERLLGICKINGVQELPAVLDRLAVGSTHVWQGGFTNSAKLAGILREMLQCEPQHPLLKQLPTSLLVDNANVAV